MFVPKRFESSIPWPQLLAQHDFGMLLTADAGELFTSHVPYLADPDARTLSLHLARANPHWRAIERQPRCRFVVQGAHGYVSPSWYETPQAVPTWNYQAVHVEGTATLEFDEARLRELLRRMVARFEDPGNAPAWALESLSEEFLRPRLRSIVGVTLRVENGEAKQKLSQDRSPSERERIVRELRARDNEELARAMASISSIDPAPA